MEGTERQLGPFCVCLGERLGAQHERICPGYGVYNLRVAVSWGLGSLARRVFDVGDLDIEVFG